MSLQLIADILLAAGALGAAVYCAVLSRRLSRLGDLETGMGGAIAILSVQVDEMTKALAQAQGSARASRDDLLALTARAETAARNMEMLLASLHDLPSVPPAPMPASAPPRPEAARPNPADQPGLTWQSRRPVRRAI